MSKGNQRTMQGVKDRKAIINQFMRECAPSLAMKERHIDAAESWHFGFSGHYPIMKSLF